MLWPYTKKMSFDVTALLSLCLLAKHKALRTGITFLLTMEVVVKVLVDFYLLNDWASLHPREGSYKEAKVHRVD